MKTLIIVESPSKIKKLASFLDDNYVVAASVGHVRDLAKKGENGLGINWELVRPIYSIPRKMKPRIDNLKKIIKDNKVEHILLATDPDREGEAISWHLSEVLKLDENNYDRIVFNEITKAAVLNAIENPRKIDFNLVHSQESRRIIDRIVGFRLSKLMQKKTKARSAGRVQSAVLKLIISNEEKIFDFKPAFWYTIDFFYNKDYLIELVEAVENKLIPIEFKTEQIAKDFISKLSNKFLVEKVELKKISVKKPLPLEMSSYLSGAYNKMSLTNYRAAQAAQSLYEKGYITYHRTDSTRISSLDFLNDAKLYFDKNFPGLFGEPLKQNKDTNSQDGHEALRVTDLKNTLDSLKNSFNQYEYKAYKFIYDTTLKALSIDGLNKVVNFYLTNTNLSSKDNTFFICKTKQILVEGFRHFDDKKEYLKDVQKELLLKENDEIKINLKDLEIISHESKPPARYNQASLVTTMKKLGIGRPSTYSPTTILLTNRNYVAYENKNYIPTELGFVVIEKLDEQFSDIVNYEYTAKMEKWLDDIALGNINYQNQIQTFYDQFEKRIKNAFENMEQKFAKPEFTGNKCPKCGNPLIMRKGPFGKFEGCINFPNCDYIHRKPKVLADKECPRCQNDLLVRKANRKGSTKAFLGCSTFPTCRYIEKIPDEEQEFYLKKIEVEEDKNKLEKYDFEKNPYDWEPKSTKDDDNLTLS